jgi:hypothetical protein
MNESGWGPMGPPVLVLLIAAVSLIVWFILHACDYGC